MHEKIIKSSDEKTISKFKELSEDEYDKLVQQHGVIIRDVVRIERSEDTHFLFEDVDFSFDTIKHLIKQGEQDAEDTLTAYQHNRKYPLRTVTKLLPLLLIM
jgi:NTE family protein